LIRDAAAAKSGKKGGKRAFAAAVTNDRLSDDTVI
jgi:hypothetical protein